jgi:hypothetical protein
MIDVHHIALFWACSTLKKVGDTYMQGPSFDDAGEDKIGNCDIFLIRVVLIKHQFELMRKCG